MFQQMKYIKNVICYLGANFFQKLALGSLLATSFITLQLVALVWCFYLL